MIAADPTRARPPGRTMASVFTAACRGRTNTARALALSAAALVLGTAPAPHAAAEGNGVMINAFRSAELATDGFAVARPSTLARGTYGARLTLDHGFRPLSFDAIAPASDYDVIRHHLTGTASVAFALHDRVTLVMGLPVSLLMRGDTPTSPGFPGTDDMLAGDPFLVGRVRLLGDEGDFIVLAAQLKLTFPLANAASHLELWSGEEGMTIQPTMLGEIALSRDLRVNLALGGRFRTHVTEQPYLTVGQELTFGAAVTYEIFRDFLDVTAEAYGTTDFGVLDGSSNSPVEAILGVRAHPTEQFHLGVAFGTALSGGYGASDFRSVLTFGYVQRAELEEEESSDAEDLAAIAAMEAEADGDSDGIVDGTDACVDEAEDIDGFEDADGCPDPDDDHDGVLDGVDTAPRSAEDVDGFEDSDGAPDPDNDADGVLDAADTCPTDAEDHDGVADDDGCPETDADTDAILDAADHCPLTLGVANEARPECAGCPASACIDPSGTIRILSRIEFETGSDVMKSESTPVLESVLAILATTPTIRHVRVEGHTDDHGVDAANLELSARRAAAVVAFLATHGIDAGRLEASGLGETRPLVPNRNNAARAQNRRVEFHIVDPAPASAPPVVTTGTEAPAPE